MESLRKFLEELPFEEFPGRLGHEPLDPEYEFASVVRESLDLEEGPVIRSRAPDNSEVRTIVGAVYGSERKIRNIFPFSMRNDSAYDLIKFYDFCCRPPKDFSWQRLRTTPPCREVVWHMEKGAQLTDIIPICTHDEEDKGPFITAGVQVVKLYGNVMGLGIHRMYFVRDNVLGCLAPPNRRVGIDLHSRKKGDEPVPMAICIGAPPAVVLASQAKVPHSQPKYAVAAGLLQAPLRTAQCLNSDIRVPAETEIVLEGEAIPGTFVDDTPFLEYTGTYSRRTDAFEVHIKTVTMRKDALYQTILTGRPPQEDGYLCAIPYASEVYRVCHAQNVEVTDMSAFFGNCVFDAVVCIKKQSDAQVRNLIHALLGNRYLKTVSVLDHDLQANETDWRFAFNTRCQPFRDIYITEPMLGASLDPSADVFQTTSKMGLDLTIPQDKDVHAFRRGGYTVTNFLKD
jgi:UbiD family decarboxylase